MTRHVMDSSVHIELLGRFRVWHGGQPQVPDGWPGRRSAELVQLLALSQGRRMLRDQVIEALWPHLDPPAGAANLRKAAHHARQALGNTDAVVLRGGVVALFPAHRVETDADRFEHAAQEALNGPDPAACAEVAASYAGDLLPDALYEEWAQQHRERLRALHVALLRSSSQWERLVEVEPTDEPAYRELIRSALDAGNQHAAIRWYGRLRTVLERDVGVQPSRESEQLYERCVADLRPAEQKVVGRQAELAQLEAGLTEAARGSLGLLAVRGAAGIGKSALCRRLASMARAQGWETVTVVPAVESGPYEPLTDAIEQLISRDRRALDRLAGRTRSVLAELTPMASPAPTLDSALTRHLVIGAVRRLLQAASDAGTVLILDDAHLADEATTEALMHLTGIGSGTECMVVLAYRPEAARAVLERGVARLDRAGRAGTIDLPPLDRADTAALAEATSRATLDATVLDKIVELAEGNPFFVQELAGNITQVKPAQLPSSVWQAIAARFVDLDEDSTSMLQRLAVIGDDLDTTRVIAVTGLRESDAFHLLDVAINAEVLTVSGSSRYRFRHELVRQALVEQMPPHHQIAVHRDAARRLVSSGGTPAAIAAHWLAGDQPAEAVTWLLTAAQHAAKLGAFADAVGYLDSLLEHAPEQPHALRLRAEALEALGDVRAPMSYAAAAAVASGSEWHDIKAKQALASVRAGRPREAVDTLGGVSPENVDGRQAHALALCGAAAMGCADAELGERKAAETYQLAVESGDPAATLVAAWAEAAAAHARGELPRLLQVSLRSTYALPELASTVFDGHLCVTERLLYGRYPYAEVTAFANELRSEAERLGAARGLAFATTLRGEAELLTGRLAAADHDLAEEARLHRAIGAGTGEAASLQRLAEVAWHQGDNDRTQALLDQALAVARETDVGFHLLDRIYGTRINTTADPAMALAVVEEAEDAVHGSLETCPGCRIMLAAPAAIASARSGDLERAARYEAIADHLTTTLMRLPGWYAALDEIRGHLVRATGDADTAGGHFSAAAEKYRRAGQPLDARRCAAERGAR